ncbi:flagellar hook-associated protein FlgK [Celerinatantimonas yamalensis]|uniref:Flagellar hook-associated protein 1 n=1 Tax=Celerinatantimonas yamalensis TaxID=559956 RepID=A0ABW9G5X9_9GAMM
MPDLLNIAGSGVLAHQRLLVTTGNNISNVNTPGYSVQRTEFQPESTGGVGRGYTNRVVNQFAQHAVWRNTAEHSQKQAYLDKLTEIDKVLSDDSLSLNPTLDKTFSHIHAMNDTPLSTSTRSLTLDGFNGLLRRFRLLNGQFANQQKHINGELKEKVSTANKLIKSLQDMNVQIMSYSGSSEQSGLSTLEDKRDKAVHDLSKILKIHTVAQSNGALLVFMGNGNSLVTEKNHAELDLRPGNPDPTQDDLYLNWTRTEAKMTPSHVGGALGGLLVYRDAVFNPSRNKLGQVAISLADAFNRQNRLGMDQEGKLGGDIFSLPKFDGLAFKGNTGNGKIAAHIIPGKASDTTPYDYLVKFQSGSNFTIQRMDGSKPIGGAVPGSTSADYQIDGLSLDFSSGGFASGDSFMMRPTLEGAQQVQLTMTQPEKLALAAPVRVDQELDNLSNAKISLSSVSNTGAGSGFTSPSGLDIHAPQKIEVNQSGGYDIFDGDGHKLASLPPSTNGRNILSQAKLSPGYDVSISGQAKPGDVFTIKYNTEGYADNFNGLKMADLQQKATVRKGLTNQADSDKMTFNDAYSAAVSFVGGNASEARLDLAASKSLLTQSENWQQSVSGVNMDEEASNMVRFQQAYAASAQVIGTAQKTFESILNALR